ncbi:hypothetical protein [Gracilimonas sp.]|uniref:hypothetical protein n=1 Tax=Gracilimonas sp. TaxID=1974203 RepID=UPI0025C6CC5A|nr:hypothetical protein [Gracilimonas sp.]
MKKSLLIPIIMAGFLVSCTTTQKIQRPDGSTEYLIACGASTGFNVCYNKANKICPSGYETLEEKSGFNRKEIRINCPSQNNDE